MSDYDFIIIGSGAGGAPVAHTLVNAGARVLMLEKGPGFRVQGERGKQTSDYRRDELLATGHEKLITTAGVANQGVPFYRSHVEPDINDEPHVYRDNKPGSRHQGRDLVTIEGYTAQCVGGGTQLYGAVSLRFAPDDFRLRSFNAGRAINDPDGSVREGLRDWPLSYDDMEPWYGTAERLIGLNGESANQAKPFSQDFYQTPLPPNPISEFAKQGMIAKGFTPYRTPLAVITQDHAPSGRSVTGSPKTGFVNRYGDPIGYKSNTWVALLRPIADRDNFTLRTNCRVRRLHSDGGGKIASVSFLDEAGREQQAQGRFVVVACSAIESVRLLKLSGLDDGHLETRINSSGLLGTHFLTHCFGGAEGRVPGRFDKSVSLDSDYAVDALTDPAFLDQEKLFAGGAIYNNTSDQALPISLARTHGSTDLDTVWKTFSDALGMVGGAMLNWIDADFGTRLSVSFMANQVPWARNHIKLHPAIRDKWDDPVAYIDKTWHPHDIRLMNVFAGVCREILEAGGVTDIGFGGVYLAENASARIANHILGGARFGSDPEDSVLDVNCRAHGLDNLYVTDGAFMPTSGGANPTLTIQANAFRVADHLKGLI